MIDYQTASELSLLWDKNKPLLVITFIDSECTTCSEYQELVIPTIMENNIEHYSVDVRNNKIPFPPMLLPTSYWFFDENRPPMVKKGIPPNKSMLIELINKAKKVYYGESTSDQEFF